MRSFTFNGIKKDWIYPVKGKRKTPFAAISRNTVSIAGRHGAFLQSSSVQPMIIEQPIAFKVDTIEEAQSLTDELASWLITDEPKSLLFDDEPNREYFAIVQNTLTDFERFIHLRTGTIQFLLLDPFGYGEEIEQNLQINSVIDNDGTAEAHPTFLIDVHEDISHAEIKNLSIEDRQGAHPSIVLGQAARIDEETQVIEELVFHDTMTSTDTWQQASEIDNGYIAGEIGVDEKGFYPELYGGAIEPLNWQGPTLQKGIGEPLQDFRADIYIENLNDQDITGQTGLLDVYFRDDNGNLIGKIGFGDAWSGKPENFGHGQVGPYEEKNRVDAYADYAAGWNNFDGMIRITRIENYWYFYFARIEEDGSHNWVHSRGRWTDNERIYMQPITTVQVSFRLWALSNRSDIHIKEIKIYKINNITLQTAVVPIIARGGDQISIDTKKFLVLKNGELANNLIDLRSQMFSLKTGENVFEVTPSGSMTISAKYRKTFY